MLTFAYPDTTIFRPCDERGLDDGRAHPFTPTLPRRFVPVLFALTMSLIVSALVSAMLVSVNTGFDGGWPVRWLRASALAWLVAFPLVFTLAPRMRRLLERAAA